MPSLAPSLPFANRKKIKEGSKDLGTNLSVGNVAVLHPLREQAVVYRAELWRATTLHTVPDAETRQESYGPQVKDSYPHQWAHPPENSIPSSKSERPLQVLVSPEGCQQLRTVSCMCIPQLGYGLLCTGWNNHQAGTP